MQPLIDVGQVPPAAVPAALSSPVGTVDEALLAECRELQRKYPPPELREPFADARWVDEMFGTPAFEQYRGMYVAVADRQVRATGPTDLAARVAGAKAYQCHPGRLYVHYIDPVEEW